LLQKGIRLQWHIAGERGGEEYSWNQSADVTFHGQITNTAVISLLCKMQFFILPSIAEGTPVSLVEAMKAGVIPIINDLPGGIQELVQTGETGYLVKNNTAEEYVQVLGSVINDKINNKRISDACIAKANTLFDPYENAKSYGLLFEQVGNGRQRTKHPIKIYGSRLDQPWLSNLLTKAVRQFTS
jgi:glycosyltransferase involved in cell wall biosynthesis